CTGSSTHAGLALMAGKAQCRKARNASNSRTNSVTRVQPRARSKAGKRLTIIQNRRARGGGGRRKQQAYNEACFRAGSAPNLVVTDDSRAFCLMSDLS